MKFYVNEDLAITHGGLLYTAGKEFPAEELGLEPKDVKVLLKEGSIIDERIYRKKHGPTEEELKAEAEKEAAAEKKAKAEADAKKRAKSAKDQRKELLKIAAELGIKKPDKMKEKELVEAIELAQAEK